MSRYETAVLASGPLAYYALAPAWVASSPSVPDLSGHGYTASWNTNKPVYQPSGVGGRGSGVKFIANNDWVVLPATLTVPANSPITIELWRYVAPSSSKAQTSAFSIRDGDNPRCQCHLPYSDDTIYWDYGSANPARRLSFVGFSRVASGRWCHFCFTAQTGAMAIWLNGTLLTRKTAADIPASSLTGGRIGSSTAGGVGDTYATDHFAVYTRVLAPVEIIRHYRAGIQKASILLPQHLIGSLTSIKTILGLAKAAVKTVDGMTTGSVKTWDGLA